MSSGKILTKTLGRNLTETKLADFEDLVKTFGEFVNISQFTHPQPRNISDTHIETTSNPFLYEGKILYGVCPHTGELIWLGSIIDSGG